MTAPGSTAMRAKPRDRPRAESRQAAACAASRPPMDAVRGDSNSTCQLNMPNGNTARGEGLVTKNSHSAKR